MMTSIAVEGAKFNVHANAIAPVAASRMTAGLMTDDMKKLVPEQVASAVAYPCHEDCTLSRRRALPVTRSSSDNREGGQET